MTNEQGVYTAQDTPDKEIIHILGGTEQDGTRMHDATQNGAWFKTYKLFISAISHLMFSYSQLRVTETIESKIVDKGELLYSH